MAESIEKFCERKVSDTSRKIIQYDMNMKELNRFDSITKAARYLIGVKRSKEATYRVGINKCCTGTDCRKSAYGYIWRYNFEK